VIRRIVVPVDGSAASEKILPHVLGLLQAFDAEIRFIHVTEPAPSAMSRGREYLEGLRERARRLFPFVEGVLLAGEPAVEIQKYAVVHRGDLIALTTRGASGLRRVLFGSTAIELMRRSQVPLFLARPTWSERPIRRILAAVDASRTSRGILPTVTQLARGSGASVVLTRVLLQEKGRERAEWSLRTQAEAIRTRGIPVETVLRPGDPAREILAAAAEESADLIALGTHGRRGSDRFFFGSVAESVLVGSEVPLLLRRTVRLPRRAAAPREGVRV